MKRKGSGRSGQMETNLHDRESMNELGSLVAELEYHNGEIYSLKDWVNRPQKYTEKLEEHRRKRDELIEKIKFMGGEK